MSETKFFTPKKTPTRNTGKSLNARSQPIGDAYNLVTAKNPTNRRRIKAITPNTSRSGICFSGCKRLFMVSVLAKTKNLKPSSRPFKLYSHHPSFGTFHSLIGFKNLKGFVSERDFRLGVLVEL